MIRLGTFVYWECLTCRGINSEKYAPLACASCGDPKYDMSNSELYPEGE